MFLFSLGVVGTGVTAARLWQTVRMLQLQRRRARWDEYQVQRMILAFLGGIETAIIPLCANMPALAAFWHARGRRRNARAIVAQRQPPGPPPGTWQRFATAINRGHKRAAAAVASFLRDSATYQRQRRSDAAPGGRLEARGNGVGGGDGGGGRGGGGGGRGGGGGGRNGGDTDTHLVRAQKTALLAPVAPALCLLKLEAKGVAV
jgi:uncharacterized membrane protein YgcG